MLKLTQEVESVDMEELSDMMPTVELLLKEKL